MNVVVVVVKSNDGMSISLTLWFHSVKLLPVFLQYLWF